MTRRSLSIQVRTGFIGTYRPDLTSGDLLAATPLIPTHLGW